MQGSAGFGDAEENFGEKVVHIGGNVFALF